MRLSYKILSHGRHIVGYLVDWNNYVYSMLKINSLDISSRGFQILEIHDHVELSSSNDGDTDWFHTGGIKVTPEVEIAGIEKGIFYATQICKIHKLEIASENNVLHKFDSTGIELRDSKCKSDTHYDYLPIINNKIMDQSEHEEKVFIFYDAPFLELFPWWREVGYEIKFETWFQYVIDQKKHYEVIPIMSFEWLLKASIEKTKGKWEMVDSVYSDEAEIRKTFKYYDASHSPLIPFELGHLLTTVEEFRQQKPELKSDFKKV